jgi:flagellar hook-associated protein 3 FlgL
MRITTNQMFTSANAHMLENQRSLAAVQEQLTSGKKFQSLSDDPLAANRIIQLEREITQYTMMNENISVANMRLDVEEEALTDLTNLTNRLQEISLALGNASLSDQNHEDFAAEMSELVGLGQSLFNSRDAKGEYLFAGSQGGKPAYELENERWVFQGDSECRNLKVSNAMKVQIADSGQELFELASPTGGGALISGPASSSVASSSVYDPTLFQAQMASLGPLDIQIVDNAGTQEMTARDRNGNVVNDTFGVPIQDIVVVPAVGSVLSLDGANITVTESANPLPDTFDIDYEAPRDNILNNTLDMIDSIRLLDVSNPVDAVKFEAKRADFINKIDKMQESMRNSISTVGARMVNLDVTKDANIDYTIISAKTLSGIQDLDYAKASTDLARTQSALEASYASFAKIQGMSLFDYIK